MGLKFRRGTTAQKSGSLAFGEPYVNTDLGTLQIGGASGDITLGSTGTGSTGAFGAISGSGLDITGNANIGGNLTIGGQVTIGDNTSDSVNVVASLSSSLIPQTTNVFDLGSATKIWKDLYISTGSIKFVDPGTNTIVGTLSSNAGGDFKVAGEISGSSINGLGNATLYSSSVATRLVAAESFSSSLDTTFATDASVTIVSASAWGAFQSASSYSGSLATSINTANFNITRLATTGSNTFSGTQTINGGINTTFSAPSTDGYSLASMFNFRRGDFTGANIRVGAGSTGYTLVGQDNNGDSVIAHIAGSGGDKPIRIYTNSANEGLTLTNQRLLINASGISVTGTIAGTLANTLTIGTGLSGTSYNNSAAVTIANTGVTSNVAGTGVSVSGATGAVTISIGQAVATSDNVRFNSLGVGMAASATAGRIDAAGDVVAFSSSDKNFKENITPIENPIEKIRKISGNTYDWKADLKDVHGYEGNDVGVIAQEIEAVLPQIVTTRENGYKAVKYEKLVALLIEGIKAQQNQIDSLTIEIENLKKNNSL